MCQTPMFLSETVLRHLFLYISEKRYLITKIQAKNKKYKGLFMRLRKIILFMFLISALLSLAGAAKSPTIRRD